MIRACVPEPQMRVRGHAWAVATRDSTASGARETGCMAGPAREFPGELDRIRVWFRDYKTPDGKPENKFGYDDQWQNKEFTLQARTHLTALLACCMLSVQMCWHACRLWTSCSLGCQL